MNLPDAQPGYDFRNESLARREIAKADAQNHKKGRDVELGMARLILQSPNGSRWALTVSNAGVVSAVAV